MAKVSSARRAVRRERLVAEDELSNRAPKPLARVLVQLSVHADVDPTYAGGRGGRGEPAKMARYTGHHLGGHSQRLRVAPHMRAPAGRVEARR